jgi:hypothetical protein
VSARTGPDPAPAGPASDRGRASVAAASAGAVPGRGFRPGQDTGLTMRPAAASCARGAADAVSLGRASRRPSPASRAGKPRRSSSVRRPDRRGLCDEGSGRSNAPSSARLGNLPGRLDAPGRAIPAPRLSAGGVSGSLEPDESDWRESLIDTTRPRRCYAGPRLIGQAPDDCGTAATPRPWRSGAQGPQPNAHGNEGPCRRPVGGPPVATTGCRPRARARGRNTSRRPRRSQRSALEYISSQHTILREEIVLL